MSKVRTNLLQYLTKKYGNVKQANDEMFYTSGVYWVAKLAYNGTILIYENRRKTYDVPALKIAIYDDPNHTTPDHIFDFKYGMTETANYTIRYVRSYENRHISLPYSVFWKLQEVMRRNALSDICETIDYLATKELNERQAPLH